MSKTFVAVLVLSAMALALIGCGGSDEGAATEPAATTSPAAESPAEEEAPSGQWTTVATLSSTDPTDDIGALVSEQFTTSDEIRLVLDMPEGGDIDGVVGAVIPADEDVSIESVAQGEAVTLPASVPEQVISGLDGAYVFVVTVPTTKAWSVEIQTRP